MIEAGQQWDADVRLAFFAMSLSEGVAMDRLILVGVVVVVVGWHWFINVQSGGRARSPLWGAFTATAVAILFIVAGAVGYKLTHGIPFTHSLEWTGRVLWSEIAVGVGAGVAAIFFWRAGLRSIRTGR
jgi:hypothetical protein